MEEETRKSGGLFRCHIPKRFTVVLLGFVGMFNTYSMRVNLSVAMVAMVNNSHVTSDSNSSFYDAECPPEVDAQQTAEKTTYNGEIYDWDPEMQGRVLSSFFCGYFVTVLLGGYAAERFGAARVLGGGLLLTGVLTLLTPAAAGLGVGPLMAVRALEGLGEGAAFPAITSLASSWSPKLERSRISAVLFSGATTGTVVTMWASGWLCGGANFLGGWPAVFYVSGSMTCAWYVLWCVFVYETPLVHPAITKDELLLFHRDYEKKTEQVFRVPWKQIACSVPFWALAVGNTGSVFALFLLLSEMPTYLSTSLHFDVHEAGMFSALPHVVLLVSMWTVSFVADKLRSSGIFTTTAIRKIFQAMSGYGSAGCLLAITLSGCRPHLIVALFCLSLGLMGGMYSGFNVTHVDMSPHFAGTLYGLTNGISSLSGILAPAMVGHFTANGYTLANWNKVFYATAAIHVLTTTLFLLFASAELQPWGLAVDEDEEKDCPEANIQMLEQQRTMNTFGKSVARNAV